MGRLVAIEGLDGAGKRTLADRLAAELSTRGVDVGRIAFPRYDTDLHAELASEALHGRLGDLAESVYGMAVLFALDRRDAIADLVELTERHDVVLCDRYVASNAAYGAARLGQDAAGAFVRWIRRLELERMRIPPPDGQLLLRTPVAVAATRADQRASGDPARTRDSYESDGGLQRRCAAVYEQLAASGWITPWLVVDDAAAHPAGVADAVLDTCRR